MNESQRSWLHGRGWRHEANTDAVKCQKCGLIQRTVALLQHGDMHSCLVTEQAMNHDPTPTRREACARGEHCRDHSDGKCCGCEQDHNPVSPSRVTDGQLRAECERRGLREYCTGYPEKLEAELGRDRDEWKRRAEAAESEHRKNLPVGVCVVGATGIPGYCWEWTDSAGNRHQSAPTPFPSSAPSGLKLTNTTHALSDYSIKAISVPNRALTSEEKAALERECAGAVKRVFDGPETVPAVLEPRVTVISRKQLRELSEDLSKGIARLPEQRPDNSVAFLDEDLLADDT